MDIEYSFVGRWCLYSCEACWRLRNSRQGSAGSPGFCCRPAASFSTTPWEKCNAAPFHRQPTDATAFLSPVCSQYRCKRSNLLSWDVTGYHTQNLSYLFWRVINQLPHQFHLELSYSNAKKFLTPPVYITLKGCQRHYVSRNRKWYSHYIRNSIICPISFTSALVSFQKQK